MNKVKPYIDSEGEVRELDEPFFTNAKRGRPPLPEAERKRRVNLMLSPAVIEALKARGAMSAEADKILREAMGL
ncbi:MAG: hypothetical protein CSA85_00510 [Alphaproteobacteria bacterium]|nr:MAG: hypothetical protein CSA85_00510 [Alphaproteobacteria bacterium]